MKLKYRSLCMAFVLLTILLAVVVPAPIHAQSSPEANKAAVVALLEGFSDPARFAEIDALIAEDFVIRFETGDVDWETAKASAQGVVDAMPDIAYTPLIMLAEGNYVALRYEFSGTFTNPMTNFDGSVLQPTGKPVVIQSNTIVTFNDDGKIVEYKEVFDNLSFLVQLGAFPAPEAALTPPAEPVDAAVWTISETSADFTATLVEALKAANLAAYNEGNVDALDAITAPEYISYPSMADLAASKVQIDAMRAAVPDLQSTNDLVIAEGNWVVYHWTAAGTFTQAFDYGGMQLAPTNQPVSFEGIVFAVANEDGLIVADWSEVDNLSIGMQFGMIPA